jgi:hypothetical protein
MRHDWWVVLKAKIHRFTLEEIRHSNSLSEMFLKGKCPAPRITRSPLIGENRSLIGVGCLAVQF